MAIEDPTLIPDDEFNPYAPPKADALPELEPLGSSGLPATVEGIVSRSWQIYRNRMGLCMGAVWLYLVLLIGAVILCSGAFAAVEDRSDVAGVVAICASLAVMLFALWLSLGLLRVLLDVARGRAAAIGGLFSGGRYLFRFILGSLLFTLAMGALVGLAGGLGAAVAALSAFAIHTSPVVGLLVTIVVAIAGYIAALILSLRLSQYACLIVDRDAGALESLRTSYRVTRGRAGLLFLLYLVATMVNIVGTLACYIGTIFTTPFIAVMFVVTYLALTGQTTADPYGKDEPLAELEPL